MQDLFYAFVNLFTITKMTYIFIGVFLGTFIGAIPGLTPTMIIALMIPLTFYMESSLAITLLLAVYVGGLSGGLITATLLRIPGTPASLVTTFDGYPLAKSGKPGRAIGIGITSSFLGGCISWLFLVLISPQLSKYALKFGPFEIFALVFMALVVIASVGKDSFIKAIMSGFLGMLVACPGIDPITSTLRLTFGYDQLLGGMSIVPILIGLFGINQIIKDLINVEEKLERIPLNFKSMFLKIKDLKKHTLNIVRSSIIGTWVGILPGIGASIGSLLAYSAAKSASKTPEKFGTGIEDGIIASETANNSVIQGAFVPLLCLGIPGNIVTAILMGALIIHGITPGPLMFTEHKDVVYNIFATLLIANVVMYFLMMMTTFFIAKLVDIPKSFLCPAILTFCVLGTFSLNNRIFDVWLMFIFGIIGFVLEKLDIPLGPFVIGLILSPIAEVKLRSALMLSQGSILPLFTRPISLTFFIIAVGLLVWNGYQQVKKLKRIN